MIVLTDVSKKFGSGGIGLENISLEIDKGEFVFLVGHTGSGKTTLLRLLLRDYLPSSGTITIENVDISSLPKGKIPNLRSKIGVVFQDLKLLVDKTILENVLLPLEIKGVNGKDAMNKALGLLEKVGILDHRDKFPVQLSGGELQRAAIARALTLDPLMILADEPTGNLDSDTAFQIVELLDEINKAGTTIIMATHNLDILKKYSKNRVIKLDSGVMISDSKNNHKTDNEKHGEKMEEHKSKHKNHSLKENLEKKRMDDNPNAEEVKNELKEESLKTEEPKNVENEGKEKIKKSLFGGKLAEKFLKRK